MTQYYLYRKNGGEVLGASTQAWPVNDYMGNYESETAVDLYTPQWSDGTTIRDATQGEIDNFPTAAAEDEVAQEKDAAKVFIDPAGGHNDPHSRAVRALVEVCRAEINTLRAEHSLAAYSEAEFNALIDAEIDAE